MNMYVEIDFNLITSQKLTPTQYFTLFLLLGGQHKLLATWLDSIDDPEYLYREIRQLIERELILNLNTEEGLDFTKLLVTPEFEKMLDKAPDTFFDELIEKYPTKAIRKDGTTDYLRTDLARCRKLYHKITNGSVKKHNHILACLDFELKIKQREDGMGYMKRLPKWLASEEWEVYAQRMADEGSIIKEQTYGTELI